MTSRPWSMMVSVLVFALVLAAGDSARAQWVVSGGSSYPPIGQFGLGYGTVQGISPFGYGSFGAGVYDGSSHFVGFPLPGYGRAIGRTPVTTTSFESVSDVVTLVPGWNGSGGHRIHRRHRAVASVPRAAIGR